MKPKTLFEKVWEQHEVAPETADTPAVLYIDLHLIHEVTTPQAFAQLRSQSLSVRRPDRTLATLDHSTPTDPAEVFGRVPIKVESAARQVKEMERNCREFGIELLGLGSEQRGIVHVIGPELGATQPGKTIVCGDSHTATHGAFGALAFGIGTTEVGHVLVVELGGEIGKEAVPAAEVEAPGLAVERRRESAGSVRHTHPPGAPAGRGLHVLRSASR